MGKGLQCKHTSTKVRGPLVVDNDTSLSQGERKKVQSAAMLNVDPEHDRSHRLQKPIWWPGESESVMRTQPRSYSYQVFVLQSVKTKSRPFWTAQRSSGFFDFPNPKKRFTCTNLLSMTPAMMTTSAVND